VTWVLLWVVLVLAAVAVFAFLGVRLFRQGKAVARELSAASERLSRISAQLAQISAAETGPGTESR
jgi:uncharacterized protein YoxC